LPLHSEDITKLYDRHAQELLAFFARRTYDPEATVDLLAQTFAAAFEDRMQFRGGDAQAARAWLYGIARHELTDYHRRGLLERSALNRLGVERRGLTDVEYDHIEALAGDEELRSSLAQELSALPHDQREALRLRIIEEQPYDDVARSLGISEPTARARVSRALRALRDSNTIANLKERPEHA
jgi:RNA polymerase sigma-70 factor (ECF subfamily)